MVLKQPLLRKKELVPEVPILPVPGKCFPCNFSTDTRENKILVCTFF